MNPISRRRLLQLVASSPIAATARSYFAAKRPISGNGKDLNMVSDSFPGQPHELVREMVTVSHFDLTRVQEIVAMRPSLVNASWDWGFGDWETPLGAASHMGNRAIAEYLLSQGAVPTLFSAAMLGQLDTVRAMLAAAPGIERNRGPHSISLLAHARMGGERSREVLEILKTKEGAEMAAPIPLKDEEAAALTGSYLFGIGVSQQIEVTADMQMYKGAMYTYSPQLNWTRKGMMTRPLFHLGQHVFFPAGAPSVRIEFKEESARSVMEVHDGDLVLTAARKKV